MARANYSIGIDLGTTNCAVAFEALDGGGTRTLEIPQWEKPGTRSESETLPSFLYLPTEAEAPSLGGDAAWVTGRFARKQSAETPGRVVHSAKSWLGHHVLDRSKPFLPWHSDSLERREHISPVQASAILLQYLRSAWDAKFPEHPLNDQEVTITVPASFDPVAQKLTLEAAKQAGYPDQVRLIEEPQAVFYRWLEHHDGADVFQSDGPTHVAVIDIGGGTSDFSLFEVTPATPLPRLRRVAVSDHLLLGGDNIDLAIAHQVEKGVPKGTELAPVQWNHLVALCRELKERCLADPSEEEFSVAIPGRGSGLFGGTLSSRISRVEIESILNDGFFPECDADAEPLEAEAGLREFALPYAADSAVTRYLAGFLRGRPQVDAILFNGGTLHPQVLRQRLIDQISAWQDGQAPVDLDNREPELAVARGAARFGAIRHKKEVRIEAGAARSVYLDVHATGSGRQLVCILPHGAEAGESFEVSLPGLELTLGRPVKFQPYYTPRRSKDRAGTLVPWDPRSFHPLPALQTVAMLPGATAESLPVNLSASLNELGLLQVVCVSADLDTDISWPLEFNLRPHEEAAPSATPVLDPGVDEATLDTALECITSYFRGSSTKKQKLTANNLLKRLEEILGQPKHQWNGTLIRSLWPPLFDCLESRAKSPDHEEAWLIMAGYLLRPGFGAEGDPARIDELWRIHSDGPAHPGKRIAVQQHVTWRRIAGGLNAERQQQIITPDLPKFDGKKASAELIRLAGAFERLDPALKARLATDFTARAADLAEAKQYCVPWLVALGLLLNRTPLFAGLSAVLPSEHVVDAYDRLREFDWSTPELNEIQTLFLRAARVVDDPALDLPKATRQKIAAQLDDAGVAAVKVEKVRSYIAIESADQAGLFGESLPPGLVLGSP